MPCLKKGPRCAGAYVGARLCGGGHVDDASYAHLDLGEDPWWSHMSGWKGSALMRHVVWAARGGGGGRVCQARLTHSTAGISGVGERERVNPPGQGLT